MNVEFALNYFSVGRLVHVKHKNIDWGWGVVINFS